jgi:hypothetical protein
MEKDMKYQRKGGPVDARQYIGVPVLDVHNILNDPDVIAKWVNRTLEFENWLNPIAERLGIIAKYRGAELVLNEHDDLDYSFDTIAKSGDWLVYENDELKVYTDETFNFVFEEVK